MVTNKTNIDKGTTERSQGHLLISSPFLKFLSPPLTSQSPKSVRTSDFSYGLELPSPHLELLTFMLEGQCKVKSK